MKHFQHVKRKIDSRIIQFMGLNRREVCSDGEMVDMLNLSSQSFPCMMPRKGRKVMFNVAGVEQMVAYSNSLIWINNNRLYVDGNDVLNKYLPFAIANMTIMNGHVILNPTPGQEAIGEAGGLMAYDLINNKEVVCGVYKDHSTGITFYGNKLVFNGDLGVLSNLKAGDAITLEGCTRSANNRSAIIESVSDNTFEFLSNTWDVGEEATEDTTYTESGTIKVMRKIPQMDFIFEADNRLWGCSSEKNEIYASKQGDFTNFNYFNGLNNDSYACSLGTEGPFTGAINYNNNMLFFKEGAIHKMYGYKPSNYQVITISAEGVKKGCSKSLVCCANMLFYVARQGVVCYNGTLPELVSAKLGNDKLTNGVAGASQSKYYLSVQRGSVKELLCYDAALEIWHKEDNVNALAFVYINDYLIYSDGYKVYAVEHEESDENVSWAAILGEMQENYNGLKCYSKLRIRVKLEEESRVNVYISHNNKGFNLVKSIYSKTKKEVDILVKPQRCDFFQVKIEGQGPSIVYSLIREYFEG